MVRKRLTPIQIQEIVKTLPGLNRDILEQSNDKLDTEDIGFAFGEDVYQETCTFILENIPYDDPISNQAAYLIRAFMCSQLFNEGNKRTAILFTYIWIRENGFRLNALSWEVWDFIKYLQMRCSPIPFSPQEIVTKDNLYQDIEIWIQKRIE